MINQKAISAKIDLTVLKTLKYYEISESKPRNRIINDAIRMYCEARKLRQLMYHQGRGSEAARRAAAQFLKEYVAPESHVYVDMIDL